MVMLVWGVYLIDEKVVSAGALFGCMMFAGRAVAPLASVVQLATRYQSARAAMQALNHVMSQPVEREPGQGLRAAARAQRPSRLLDVGFAYPATGGVEGPRVLTNMTLKFEPGERVAILGRIGSGKSTILRLLAGLYQPGTARSRPTASTCARSTRPTTAPASASSRRTRACSTARCATTCCWTGPRPTPRAWPRWRA
jgi:ATP-binding cassette subfamily C protein LapB